MQSVNSNTFSLEEFLGKIEVNVDVNDVVAQLPAETGVVDVKTLNNELNSNNYEVTKLFCETLGKTCSLDAAYVAAKLKTDAAKEFVWGYIKEKKYDEDYQTIGLICDLIKSKLKNECFDRMNPHYDRTISGFYLYFNHRVGPMLIATPFGRIELTGNSNLSTDALLPIFTLFIDQLGATFQGCGPASSVIDSNKAKHSFHEVREGKLIEIDEKDVESKKGTNSLIFSGRDHHVSQYEINKVAEKTLPKPVMEDRNATLPSRRYALAGCIWKMLKDDALSMKKG